MVSGYVMRTGRAVLPFLRAHGLFGVAVVAAVAVRWIATLGYPTVLWFDDSRAYLEAAVRLQPSTVRPSGYSVFLWLLKPLHSFLWVVGVQHMLGVAVAVMVYALVWRHGRDVWTRHRWLPGVLATACALPVLFDAYQIQVEHLLMADMLFMFLTFAAVTMVLWLRRMRWWTGAIAGLLLAAATVTRPVALPVLLLAIAAMLIRRAGWRAVLAVAVAGTVPVLLYMSWFKAEHGRFALSDTDSIWLYGRTADFADCAVLKPRPELAAFCRDGLPPRHDIAPAMAAIWSHDSAFHRYPGWVTDPRANELAGEFAWLAISKQPGGYLAVVGRDVGRAFEWKRRAYPAESTVSRYRFREGASLKDLEAIWAYPYGGRTAEARVVEPYGGWMRGYQRNVFMPGTFLGVLLLAGLGGVVLRWRQWGGEMFLPWSASLAMLVVPAATADFDYRYVLPAVPFAVLAAGLTVTGLARDRSREPRPAVRPRTWRSFLPAWPASG